MDAPVTWSPSAAVHHLALDVERWWFDAIVAQILIDVIGETAAHAGQLDVVREFINGTQWLVLDCPETDNGG